MQLVKQAWTKNDLKEIFMKKISWIKYWTAAAILLCQHLSYAQSNWFWQNPLPQGNNLNSVFFTDANKGTAVGLSGTILRTTNGGASWAIQSSGTTMPLYGSWFTDANTGTLVGSSDTILRTTDGGASWAIQSSGTTNNLYGVCFMNADTGIAVGNAGTILRTTDGGASWGIQSSGTANNLCGICFINADTWTAVGNAGTILRTTNGGASWTSQPGGTTNNLRSICFINADTGTVVGNASTIFRTTDGGTSWTNQSIGTNNQTGISYNLCGVSFKNADTGIVVGQSGTILQTTNGGASWTSQSSEVYFDLSSICFTDANTGTIVGSTGTILRTTNGGISWTSLLSGTTQPLSNICFTDSNKGTAVGGNYNYQTILRTTNGGANWTSQINLLQAPLYSIFFTDTNTGTAVGAYGIILRTTDGGINWTNQPSGTSNVLYDVCFTNTDTGTAVGSNGTILRTTNGGNNWTSQLSGMPDYSYTFFTNVCFIDANTGWAIGSGNIFHTTNGGNNWTSQPSGTTPSLSSVFFTDANTGTAVGNNGTILRTSDGGSSWTNQPSGTTSALSRVSFTSGNTGTVVGSGGTILCTTNGGTSWISQPSGTLNWLSGVSFNDANTGWVAGSNGTIFRTNNNGGIPLHNTIILSSSSLSFWKVMVSKYKETTIIIKNAGSDTLHLSNFTSNNPVFSVRPGLLNVAPGQKSVDTLRFTPAAVGDAAGTILVYSSSPSSPDTLKVYGNGFITGVTQLNNNNINFGKVLIGQSKDTTVAMNNIGNDTLKISSVVSSSGAFLSKTTKVNILPGTAFIDTIHFAPTTLGIQAAGLIISSSSPTSPDLLNIYGTCFGIPAIQFNAKTISVGKVGIGQHKDTTVTITNTGTDTVKISSVVSSDSIFVPRLAVMNIAPGQSSIDTLRFSPIILGADSAWITILSNAHSFPDTVKVTGIGDVGTKVDQGTELPKSYALSQNYPNPFNPSTTIAFALPSHSFVTLKIYDMLGREVAVLASEELAAGNYTRQWNAASLSSGIYFYRLEAGSFAKTKKLILLK